MSSCPLRVGGGAENILNISNLPSTAFSSVTVFVTGHRVVTGRCSFSGHCSCGHCPCGHFSCGHCSCGHCSCGCCSCGHCSCGHCSCGHCSCGHCPCGHCPCGHCPCGHCPCGHCSCGHCSCGHCSCGHRACRRDSLPLHTALKVPARAEKSVPLYRGGNEFSILGKRLRGYALTRL